MIATTRFSHLQPFQLQIMRNACKHDGVPELAGHCWKDRPEPAECEMVRMASALDVYASVNSNMGETAHLAKLLRLMATGAQWQVLDLGLPGHPSTRTVLSL